MVIGAVLHLFIAIFNKYNFHYTYIVNMYIVTLRPYLPPGWRRNVRKMRFLAFCSSSERLISEIPGGAIRPQRIRVVRSFCHSEGCDGWSDGVGGVCIFISAFHDLISLF